VETNVSIVCPAARENFLKNKPVALFVVIGGIIAASVLAE
jgi:hypothetical protein